MRAKMEEENNNKGLGLAFMTIVLLMFVLPSVALLSMDNTWERFVIKYGSPISTDCWENSKHERVCRDKNNCRFGRLFCINEVFRWRVK
jgi:hypothetical protein